MRGAKFIFSAVNQPKWKNINIRTTFLLDFEVQATHRELFGPLNICSNNWSAYFASLPKSSSAECGSIVLISKAHNFTDRI